MGYWIMCQVQVILDFLFHAYTWTTTAQVVWGIECPFPIQFVWTTGRINGWWSRGKVIIECRREDLHSFGVRCVLFHEIGHAVRDQEGLHWGSLVNELTAIQHAVSILGPECAQHEFLTSWLPYWEGAQEKFREEVRVEASGFFAEYGIEHPA